MRKGPWAWSTQELGREWMVGVGKWTATSTGSPADCTWVMVSSLGGAKPHQTMARGRGCFCVEIGNYCTNSV